MGPDLQSQPVSGMRNMIFNGSHDVGLTWPLLPSCVPLDVESLKCGLIQDLGSLWVILYHSVMTRNMQVNAADLNLRTWDQGSPFLHADHSLSHCLHPHFLGLGP